MGITKFRRKVVGNKADFKEQVVVLKESLDATSGAGTPASISNPLGTRLIVTRVVVDITSPISATPVEMNVGIGGSPYVAYDTLIDGLTVGTPTSADVYDNVDDQGTNGKSTEEWGASEYLTVTVTGTPTGMVGNIYVYYREP